MLASTFQYLLPESKSRRPEGLICNGVLSCFTHELNPWEIRQKNFIRKFLILGKICNVLLSHFKEKKCTSLRKLPLGFWKFSLAFSFIDQKPWN